MQTPEEVRDKVVGIYESNKGSMTEEYYPKYFTLWNLDEVNITQVRVYCEITSMRIYLKYNMKVDYICTEER